MVTLPATLVSMMTHQAQATPSVEVCGLVSRDSTGKLHHYPVSNIASQPECLFEMDPREQIAAMRQIRERDESMFAIYHSHPTSPAIPSKTDRELAAYPEALHLIISLHNAVPEIRGYRWNEGEFREVPLSYRETADHQN